MRRARFVVAFAAGAACLAWASVGFGASGLRPAPEGSFRGAPSELTRFTPGELARGFLALAFGSDLRLGPKLKRIHRFDHPVRIHVIAPGGGERLDAYRRVIADFAKALPALAITMTDDRERADIAVRLIAEKDFPAAIASAFGARAARVFLAKTDAQCMTSVKSELEGPIMRADSFVIVDQGDDVFFNCAYHEMLHALGLPNHDQTNPWTALNQNRTVGYLTVYDRAMLRILYDPRMRSGLSHQQAAAVLGPLAREVAAAP